MTTYKSMVRGHLQPLLDAGATQRQIADSLGLENPNFISMVLSDRYPNALLSFPRLRAMCALCGLSATQSLSLVRQLSKVSGKKSVQFDEETFEWMLRCTALALKEPRGAV